MATLTEGQRELLERTLDALALAAGEKDPMQRHHALRLYETAVALVRERPAGSRRIRSDFNRPRRNTAQLEIGA